MRLKNKKLPKKRRRVLSEHFVGVQKEPGGWFFTLPTLAGSAASHGPFPTDVEAAYARDREIVKTHPLALTNFPPYPGFHRNQKLKLPPRDRMYPTCGPHRVRKRRGNA